MYVGTTNVVSEVFVMQVAVHSADNRTLCIIYEHRCPFAQGIYSIIFTTPIAFTFVTCREEGVDIVLLVANMIVTC